MRFLVILLLCSVSFAAMPASNHVFIVVEENRAYADVFINMPYLVSLGDTYARTSNYHANVSGSMMDYLWLSSGSSETAFGCNGAGCTSPITSDNIFRHLISAGKTFKAYQESIPSIGFMGSSSGDYVKRHNPVPWYSDIINSVPLQQNMVPFTQLATDLSNNTAPNYSFITPNMQHDAHDGTMAAADSWLQTQLLPNILASSYFQPGGDGVLIITFDECDAAGTGVCGGANELVYTAVIGPLAARGVVSATSYLHQHTLHTMMELLGLSPYPGAAATATSMADLFISPITSCRLNDILEDTARLRVQ